MIDHNYRLWARAHSILDRRANGFARPILWHLMLRNYGYAMLDIAQYLNSSGDRKELGRVSDRYSPAGLTYRAYRTGVPNAAQNMAMNRFNIGDLAGYRYWIRLAARDDPDAEIEARLFETRQPHPLARGLRRLRPYRRDGS